MAPENRNPARGDAPGKKIIKPGVNLPGTVTRTTWQLPGDLGEDDWRECGLVLGKMQGAIQWWIGDWWAFGEARYGERKAIVEAEDWGGPSLQTCMDAGWVASKFTTSRRREVSFNHHREVAALEQADQDYWLDKTEADGLSVMKLRAAIRQGGAADRTEATELDAKKLGKFAIILADPPWRYEHPPMGGTGRSVENHYPTMPLEEICALPIAEIANDDALLFLWATAPKLYECMKVIDAWEFTYRTSMVWVKDKIGMGYYARNQHELLLVCRRGELPPPLESARPASVVEAPRDKHSEKPRIFYDVIDAMYPGLRKIELFNRGGLDRKNWHVWGNQA